MAISFLGAKGYFMHDDKPKKKPKKGRHILTAFPGGYSICPRALRRLEWPGNTKWVFSYMLSCINGKTGRIWPSLDQIAAECGISRNGANNARNELESNGVVRKIPLADKNTKTNSSEFVPVWPVIYDLFGLKSERAKTEADLLRAGIRIETGADGKPRPEFLPALANLMAEPEKPGTATSPSQPLPAPAAQAPAPQPAPKLQPEPDIFDKPIYKPKPESGTKEHLELLLQNQKDAMDERNRERNTPEFKKAAAEAEAKRAACEAAMIAKFELDFAAEKKAKLQAVDAQKYAHLQPQDKPKPSIPIGPSARFETQKLGWIEPC